jgi:hypothetical protein
MAVTLEQARAILDVRDRSFVAGDIESYLSIWAADCTVEGPSHFIQGRDNLRNVIEAAWSVQEPIHMSTRSVGVADDMMFHEFVVVWERRDSNERWLHSGSTVCGVDANGHWSWLREYFDPAETQRGSVARLPAIRELLAKETVQVS